MYFTKVKRRGHAFEFKQMGVQAETSKNSLNSVSAFIHCIANM